MAGLDRHRDEAEVDVGARAAQRVLRQQLTGADALLAAT